MEEREDFNPAEEDGVIRYEINNRKYVLNETLAKKAFAGKRVINGRNSPEFNVLPLKYTWAYDLYRVMEANHWVPNEVPMFDDITHWNDNNILNETEKNLLKIGLGYFSASEGLVGDSAYNVIREQMCAPELKMVVGRHVHEENIHTESLLYMISSLNINPHEVTSLFLSLPSIIKKNELIVKNVPLLKKDIDLTKTENKKKFAELIFAITQVMEGSMFFALFLPILHLCRCGKMPGVGQMFRYTIRDESNHIELGRMILLELFFEEPDILDEEFIKSMSSFMELAMETEKEFVEDILPKSLPGMNKEDVKKFVCYNANRRLADLGWDPVIKFDGKIVTENPFPWASEVIYLKKNENFFESRVTEYSKVSNLIGVQKESELFEGIKLSDVDGV